MENISDYLPMSETAYFILLSLQEERHGYAVMQYVSKITNGRVNLGAGTLYGTLSKMEKNKLISFSFESDKRKYYIITPFGKEILQAEFERLAELYNSGHDSGLRTR